MAAGNKAGAWGEEIAADYLRRKGCRIITCGYSCKFGEIDIIAADKAYLLFVEVKLRKNRNFAAARENVDWRKQNRIRTTASMYLARYPTRLQPRFDVIEIYAPKGQETAYPEIIHLEDAFE